MPQETDRDIREEVGISLFWRELIGDYEYGRFNPDDMIRWYDALKLRGADEIRDLINERYTGRPGTVVRGVVAGAPHPPVWLVREWLALYENKVRTGGYWMAAAGFIVFCGLFVPFIAGTTRLTPLSTYVMHPPFGGPQTFQPNGPASGPVLSATTTAPPAVSMPGPTGPTSGGIAGAATGVSPAGGTTGAVNGGLSAGAVSPAPGIGATQP